MTKSANFISSTDYATLKNDAKSPTVTVVIPSSVAIPSAGSVEFHTDVTIGTVGSLNRSRILSSKDANREWVAHQHTWDRFGSNGGSPAPYTIIAFIYRISPTVLRCQVYIPNPYSGTTTGESGAETIGFNVNTFLSPFAN